MRTRVIGQRDIRRLLPMSDCIERMREAFLALDAGEALNPLRWCMRLPDRRGILGLMPGMLEQPAALGFKAVSVFPGNHDTPHDSHQGVVVLFDPRYGLPIAILDASEITAIRTAAATAVATDALARDDAGDLALLGSGVQARTHLAAMAEVRTLRRVRVFSPTREHRESFAWRESEVLGLTVEAVDTVERAVTGADLICTTTSSPEPVLQGGWLLEGAHVNAVGASVPGARELDSEAVRRSRLFVDRIESAVNEAGDFLFPRDEGLIDESHIAGEIGALLAGKVAGRTDPSQITLFKSLGLAVEDLAAAQHVLERAEAESAGTLVDLVGGGDATA